MSVRGHYGNPLTATLRNDLSSFFLESVSLEPLINLRLQPDGSILGFAVIWDTRYSHVVPVSFEPCQRQARFLEV